MDSRKMELPYFALFLVRQYSRPHYLNLYERYAKLVGHQWHELKDALAGENAQKVANKLSEYLDAEEKFREAKVEIVALRERHDEGKQRERCQWSKFIEQSKRDKNEPQTTEEWKELFGHFKRDKKEERTKEEWSALFGHFKWVIQKNEPLARNSFLELFKLVQPWGYNWERQLVANKIIESR